MSHRFHGSDYQNHSYHISTIGGRSPYRAKPPPATIIGNDRWDRDYFAHAISFSGSVSIRETRRPSSLVVQRCFTNELRSDSRSLTRIKIESELATEIIEYLDVRLEPWTEEVHQTVVFARGAHQ